MIFSETKLKGAFVIDVEKQEDDRGFFARSWDEKNFELLGLSTRIVQCNISFNNQKGTLRGLHYQASPYEEVKLVRCTRGKIFDVIVDLRAESKTFKEWHGVELSEDNHKMIYIPKGFAHGFQTLENNTELFYQMSEFYKSDHARGVRWNDPVLKIDWPLESSIISRKDLSLPLLEDSF